MWLSSNGQTGHAPGAAPRDRLRAARQRLSRDRGRRRAGRNLRALSEREVERFFERGEARLPSPFTPQDRLRGYRFATLIRRLEVSDARVFHPRAGLAQRLMPAISPTSLAAVSTPQPPWANCRSRLD